MTKKKKKRVKFKKILILLFVLILIIFVLVFGIKKLTTKKEVVTKEVEVIDSINNFDYHLNDNETKYYNELFTLLKELLNNEGYDEKEYAILVSKLFLADFYDLNSKVMKSDVGGIQFVYSNYRNDFTLGAVDSIYKFVESNVYGDRKQKLPVVKNVELVSVSNDSFEYLDEVDENAYYLDMKIDYEKDLGYPTLVSLVLIHNGDKLEIAMMDSE